MLRVWVHWLVVCFASIIFQPTVLADWDQNDLKGMEWREVGPYRGGRSAAVAGIPQQVDTYYFGSTGGGVWKTDDAGAHWQNVSDGFFGGSIGAIAVSEWDPNVVYVGTGEKTVRGNVSHGNGIWKSLDAGRSWQHVGLPDSRHIPRIRVHPRNSDWVYAAALGHLYGPNEQRGVFRSTDGGENWERVLYVDENVGAVDLVLDPTNPRILYASTWRVIRRPYSLESGGEGSSLWKSTDGGDSWVSLKENKGLPKGVWGISGITVSASNPDNLYAIIEAEEGGVFRSQDGGETWRRTNHERKLRQRAWYYSRIYADPLDEQTVYVLNVRFHQSSDGGRSFESIRTPHGDNHDLWINPHDPKRMIESNDGGANITMDSGQHWSQQNNQATAQMYRVSIDNAFPYRLLGGQQDNSAIRIRSRSARNNAIGLRDWEPTAGGESGHIVAKPDNPDIVYGGSYGGYLIRLNHANGDVRAVNIWPNDPMGWGAAELKYRFNWNFPLLFSPHDSNTLYAGANVIFKTNNEGHTWQAISPDLTRNLKDKQGPSGGPITKDNTSVEYYGTIFAIAESKLKSGVIWTGSDDGLVHITTDSGLSWNDVTPKGLPDEIQINSLEAHPFEAGGLYLAATAYKSDNFKPYLYRTTDYGRSWKLITTGIPADEFARVIRADHQQAGLLFAGTEKGIYTSTNDGKSWQAMQLNLPIVPITDLALKENDLIAATQGRGYWILDDIGILRQLVADGLDDKNRLFQPSASFRLANGATENPVHMGQNPPAGVRFRYWLKEALNKDDEIKLKLYDADHKLIREYVAKPEESVGSDNQYDAWGEDPRQLDTAQGMNEFVWNLTYPAAGRFKNLVLWNDDLDGPKAIPGLYSAELLVAGESLKVTFEIKPDPRLTLTQEEYRAQFDFVFELNHLIDEIHLAVRDLRRLRDRLASVQKRIKGDEEYMTLWEKGRQIIEQLDEMEQTLYQTNLESPQDPLNYPIRVNDKLAGLKRLAAYGDHAPTESMLEVRTLLESEARSVLEKLESIYMRDVPEYNQLAQGLALSVLPE